MTDFISGMIFMAMLWAAWHFIFGPWWRTRRAKKK
jgi:hypothetical protein